MALIFAHTPGRVVRVQTRSAAAAQLSVYRLTPALTFDSHRAIVTGIALGQNVNIQFLHTLGSFVHVYVFGDRIGTATFHGLSFAKACNQSDRQMGLELLLSWYGSNKASRRRDPLRLTIGSVVMEGFVVGMETSVHDTYSGLMEFTIGMSLLPEN